MDFENINLNLEELQQLIRVNQNKDTVKMLYIILDIKTSLRYLYDEYGLKPNNYEQVIPLQSSDEFENKVREKIIERRELFTPLEKQHDQTEIEAYNKEQLNYDTVNNLETSLNTVVLNHKIKEDIKKHRKVVSNIGELKDLIEKHKMNSLEIQSLTNFITEFVKDINIPTKPVSQKAESPTPPHESACSALP
jgi:hypothetical protein